jgi:hypothetical protein
MVREDGIRMALSQRPVIRFSLLTREWIYKKVWKGDNGRVPIIAQYGLSHNGYQLTGISSYALENKKYLLSTIIMYEYR